VVMVVFGRVHKPGSWGHQAKNTRNAKQHVKEIEQRN